MNCSHFRLKVSPYLDYELSFTELNVFLRHSQGCTECAGLLAHMEGIKVNLSQDVPASLSPEFIAKLQKRIKKEAHSKPAWWQQLTTPQIYGFSPLSISGLAAAALAMVLVGASLLRQDSAPLLAPPQSSVQQKIPSSISPQPAGIIPPNPHASMAAAGDSGGHYQDSSRRDFSRQIRYVNQEK